MSNRLPFNSVESQLKSKLPGGVFTVSAQRSRAMAAVRGSGNRTTEIRLQMGLVRKGISGWTKQRTDLPGKPDFYFEGARLAVFVDGCFWHGCRKCGHIPKSHQDFWAAKIDGNHQRHRKVARLLNAQRIGTMRFWEHQLVQGLDICLLRIEKRLQRRDKYSTRPKRTHPDKKYSSGL